MNFQFVDLLIPLNKGLGKIFSMTGGLAEPLDLVKAYLDERVFLKCRDQRSITGILHAFDPHMNMVLSEAEETSETTGKRLIDMIFVRGDVLILVAPVETESS